jgi:polyisoprenoid-binding protein YceI
VPRVTPVRAVLAVAALAVVVLAGGYAYLAFTGADAPPPPRLGGRSAPAAPGSRAYTPAAGSFVGYRVEEKYLGVGVRTAVGRTGAVAGTVTADGDRITAAHLRADMTTLRSDQAQRDLTLGVRAIETRRYPRAAFTLSRAAPLSGRAEGTLELHGRRAPIAVTLRGRRAARDRLELVGSAPIDFGAFGIEPPSVAGLVTVRDHGRLEFRLVLTARDAGHAHG